MEAEIRKLIAVTLPASPAQAAQHPQFMPPEADANKNQAYRAEARKRLYDLAQLAVAVRAAGKATRLCFSTSRL